MKKIIALFLIIFMAMLCTGCKIIFVANSDETDTDTANDSVQNSLPASEKYQPEVTTDTETEAATDAESEADTDVETVAPDVAPIEELPPEDPTLTLETIQKAAEDAGYTISTDYIDMSDCNAAAGFMIDFRTDSTQRDIRVMEFPTVADALAFAKTINASGTNLAIVNGKFLTDTSATFGIPNNEPQKTFLETIMRSKIMNWPGFTPESSYSKDYKGTVEFIKDMDTAFNIVLQRSVLLYQMENPGDTAANLSFTYFSTPLDGNITMYPMFCEDQTIVNEGLKFWELFGATELELDCTLNDYTMTGIRAGMTDPFEIHAQYDSVTGSIRIIDKQSDEIIFFYEMIPQGNDKYAIQSSDSRFLIEYKNGEVTSFTMTKYSSDVISVTVMGDTDGSTTSEITTTEAAVYSPDKDSLYPSGILDPAWVTSADTDAFEQIVTFDGTTINCDIKSFFGDNIKVSFPKL